MLPNVSMVIGHGGHATTMAALDHNLPVIVLPMLTFMDQKTIGQAGAGLLLPKRSSPARIRQAVNQLLTDDRYGRAAERIGAEIRGQDGAGSAADAIAATLSQPVRDG